MESREALMRYLDGEARPEEVAEMDRALQHSTELQRELALYRAMKTDLQQLTFSPEAFGPSVWSRVHARLTRPLGWLLVLAGALSWIAYGTFVYARSSIATWEKFATGGIALGIVLLFATVLYERYRAWQVDPYRDVYR